MRIDKTLLIALALLAADFQVAAGQDSTSVLAPSLNPALNRTPYVTEPGPLLDASVDRATYRLGPGDRLEMGIFGSFNDHQGLIVSPDGSVVVSGMGVVRVLGLTINEAEARVRAAVARLYQGVEVRLTLSRVRSFKVFVVGNVPEPGMRTANAATRVSEVVDPVGANGTIRRNILLRRSSGDTLRVDLVPFLQKGDLRANPTLLEGDAVVVPVVDATVNVYGRVNFPGVYEHRQGETLAELLSVSNGGGGFPASAADTIRLTRFGPGESREVHLLARADAAGAVGRGMVLQPHDAVFVPEVANFRLQKVAVANGQVMRPGTYPIRPDTTTLRELLAMAGGLTPNASLVNATLTRQPVRGVLNRPTGSDAASDSVLTPEERQVRLLSHVTGAEEFVVVDLEGLTQGGHPAGDERLQDGDVLTIPERRNEVIVRGAVLRPGIVHYEHGLGFHEYIRLAGGLSRGADRQHVAIIRAGASNMVEAEDVWYPQPGDQVVVPFRTRRTLVERLQAIQTVVGILSSAVVAVAIITQ
jgi:protein involved in polysaccharide export with SLBB domain